MAEDANPSVDPQQMRPSAHTPSRLTGIVRAGKRPVSKAGTPAPMS